jgi:hypothetical protein
MKSLNMKIIAPHEGSSDTMSAESSHIGISSLSLFKNKSVIITMARGDGVSA